PTSSTPTPMRQAHQARTRSRATATAEEGFVKELTWLTDWVKRRQRQLEDLALRVGQPHDLRHRLHQLTADEKAILRRYMSGNTRTQQLDLSNGAVSALARDRILITVTQVRGASSRGSGSISSSARNCWQNRRPRPSLSPGDKTVPRRSSSPIRCLSLPC